MWSFVGPPQYICRGQLRTYFEGHRHGRAVSGRRDVRRRRTHRRRVAAVRRILRLRLAVAALEGEAERDLALELRPHFFEEREGGSRRISDASKIAIRHSCQFGRRCVQLATKRRRQRRRGRCTASRARSRCGGQHLEGLAGIEQSPLHQIRRGALTCGLLKLGDRGSLQLQKTRSLLMPRPELARTSAVLPRWSAAARTHRAPWTARSRQTATGRRRERDEDWRTPAIAVSVTSFWTTMKARRTDRGKSSLYCWVRPCIRPTKQHVATQLAARGGSQPPARIVSE